MAQWALWMVNLSALSILVGAVGIFFVFRTLKETRKGNKINRRIGEAQVRAYLAIKSPRITPSAQTRSFQIQFGVQNFGNSPAKDFAYCVLVRLRAVDAAASFTPRENAIDYPLYPINDGRPLPTAMDDPIVVTGNVPGLEFTDDEMSALEAGGTLSVDVSIGIRFEDVFEKTVKDVEHFKIITPLKLGKPSALFHTADGNGSHSLLTD